VVYQVKDILPGYASSEPGYVTELGGMVLFAANDGATGAELWRSDGTAQGTRLVKDILPGPTGSEPGSLKNGDSSPGFVALDGRVFFPANDGATGTELWTSDGTEAGTFRMMDIRRGVIGSNPAWLTVAGHRLFFKANDGIAGEELWVSDGTPVGTRLLADVMPGAPGSLPGSLTPVGDRLFWRASGPNQTGTWALWTTDDTAAGTRLVKDVEPEPRSLVNVGGTLYFVVADRPWEHELYVLWKSDGTSAGTVPIKELFDGANSFLPQYLTPVGDALYFRALQKPGLWKSNGTPESTVKVSGKCKEWLVNVQGTLFCLDRSDGDTSFAIWRSAGTPSDTCMVKDGFSLEGGKPWQPTGIGGRFLFRAGQEGAGSELWKGDGTGAGTMLARDILPGSETSHPREIVVAGERVFFVADDGVSGNELWAFGAATPPAPAPPPRPSPLPGNHAPTITELTVHEPGAGPGPPLPFSYGRVDCHVEDADGDLVTVTATVTNGGWGWIDHQTSTFAAGESLPPDGVWFMTTLYTMRPTDARVTCRAFDAQGCEATPVSVDLAIR
jgi:ELWxxDGT repeat protein